MLARTSLLACAGGLLIATPAKADDPDQIAPPPIVVSDPQTQPAPTYPAPMIVEEQPDPYGYSWADPRMSSRIGVGLFLGGGVTGFTDRTMRDTMSSDVAGLWGFRASIGTHVPLGIDLMYNGMAADVSTLSGQPNGTLIGTAFEGALRYNLLPHFDFTPYLFAGIGWQHYDVSNIRFSQSDTGLKASDDVADFPMGLGLSFRDMSGFSLDLRGTYRRTTDSTLVLDQQSGTFAGLDSWEASAAIGYEY